MTTKEQLAQNLPVILEINENKQLGLLKDLVSFVIRIPVENAFGKRNSKKVNEMRMGMKTLFTKIVTEGERGDERILEKATNEHKLLRQAENDWERGKIRGFNVKNRRDEADAAMDRLFDFVKVAKKQLN